jgi:hypothetical protein
MIISQLEVIMPDFNYDDDDCYYSSSCDECFPSQCSCTNLYKEEKGIYPDDEIDVFRLAAATKVGVLEKLHRQSLSDDLDSIPF